MASADAVSSVGPEQPLSVHSIPASEPGAWATAMNNLGIVPMGLNAQQILSEPLCLQRFDPALGLLTPLNPLMGLGLVHSPGPGPDLPVVKEIIHCKSCTLFPQNPNLPPPSTRERPPGCRTVFVGGLPENATEEIIREVFDQCGEIMAIRKSKKNFCHIRFSEEFMVDKAIYLSGYRMRIGSSTDKKDSGKIHVDFAQARDDLYEWECKQRLWAREERHRQRVQEQLLRPPSPPPIMHYSEHEAGLLADRLKDDHKFSDAAAVLYTWIERGEVNRRNANHFYSMIQSTNSHVRQLINDKAQSEEELERAKEAFKNALLSILNQFEQICGVFSSASKQKAWDHFTKAQRKNIEIWRKQCEELRNAHSEEVMGIRREEEMEMSEDEEAEHLCKRVCTDKNGVQSQASLCEENDSLRWQLDAYRNEVDLLRRESRGRGPEEDQAPNQGLNQGLNQALNQGLNQSQGLNQGLNLGLNHSSEAQIQQLQQNMHHMQQQLLSLQEQLRSREDELEQAREDQKVLEREVHSLTDKLLNNNVETVESTSSELQDKVVSGCVPCLCPSRERRGEGLRRGGVVSEREALLLGVMSTFLHVHPFGANLEYLWSYIQRLDSKATAAELERLMLRLPSIFRQELSGVGANLEKRWKFCGFDTLGTQ